MRRQRTPAKPLLVPRQPVTLFSYSDHPPSTPKPVKLNSKVSHLRRSAEEKTFGRPCPLHLRSLRPPTSSPGTRPHCDRPPTAPAGPRSRLGPPGRGPPPRVPKLLWSQLRPPRGFPLNSSQGRTGRTTKKKSGKKWTTRSCYRHRQLGWERLRRRWKLPGPRPSLPPSRRRRPPGREIAACRAGPGCHPPLAAPGRAAERQRAPGRRPWAKPGWVPGPGRGWAAGEVAVAAPKPLGRAGAVVDDGGDDAESDATPPSSHSPGPVTAATAPPPALTSGFWTNQNPAYRKWLLPERVEFERWGEVLGVQGPDSLGAWLCSGEAGFCDALAGWLGRFECCDKPLACRRNFLLASLSADCLGCPTWGQGVCQSVLSGFRSSYWSVTWCKYLSNVLVVVLTISNTSNSVHLTKLFAGIKWANACKRLWRDHNYKKHSGNLLNRSIGSPYTPVISLVSFGYGTGGTDKDTFYIQ